MNSLIPLLLITLSLVIVTRAKSHNHCNDECLTKTYCLSSDGSGTCSKHNLVTAKWSVTLQNQGDDLLGLTLVGHGIGLKDEKTISLTFMKSRASSQTIYSCYKSSLGSTTSKVQTILSSTYTVTIYSGSSYYSDDVLTCTWFFNPSHDSYPLYHDADVDLVTKSDYQLTMQYGEVEGVVATDTSQLPIYRMQFLKCCYKVHGNADYIMVTNQTKDNSYLVQMMGQSINELTITLTDSNNTQLLIKCNTLSNYVQGTIKTQMKAISISDQLYNTYVSKSRCKWSHPLELIDFPSPYDTTNGVYDLQLIADGLIVYTEKGIELKNETSNLFSGSTTLIMTLFTLFLNWFIWS